MEYRILPHTNLKVSRLSFGTMPFGSQADQTTSTRMVDQCLDAGIQFFDTANMYNKGVAESLLGNALAGRRQGVILASKVRHRWNDNPEDVDLSRGAILKALDASLKRLQTDYVDLYYLHQPDYDVPLEETLSAMDEVVRARARFAIRPSPTTPLGRCVRSFGGVKKAGSSLRTRRNPCTTCSRAASRKSTYPSASALE